MRYNWNNVIAAVGLMTDEPGIEDTITGKGFSVTRTDAGKFSIELEQIEFPETDVPTEPSETEPQPGAITAKPSEVEKSEPTPEPTPEPTTEPTPEPTAESPNPETAVATGQVTPETETTATGQ